MRQSLTHMTRPHMNVSCVFTNLKLMPLRVAALLAAAPTNLSACTWFRFLNDQKHSFIGRTLEWPAIGTARPRAFPADTTSESSNRNTDLSVSVSYSILADQTHRVYDFLTWNNYDIRKVSLSKVDFANTT